MDIAREYRRVFGETPSLIARAPGRVNLIGEHTDYNDGFVLPIAIDRDVVIAAGLYDGEVSLYSVNMNDFSYFSPDNIDFDEESGWSNYTRGVVSVLRERGFQIAGANLAIYGNVPIGSGLSSSAALEVASAMAFQGLNGFEMDGSAMALLCQEAENDFIGVKCGIMDQFVSRLGEDGCALFLDCRSLEYENVRLPNRGLKVVISDSLKKRGLVDSKYNERRAECEEAVEVLGNFLPGIKALRDVSVKDFVQFRNELTPVTRMRAEHVVRENARVLEGVEALKAKDVARFGALMDESHDSLRDLYEVSCDELDVLVEAARGVSGVFGSRMTGAGFGGCTVSLVNEDAVDAFTDVVTFKFERQFGRTPAVYVCSPKAGAETIKI